MCIIFADWFAARVGNDELVVVSPDVGGVKRAEALRQSLEHKLQRPIGNAFLEKYRSAGVVSGQAVVGDVRDKVAIIIDDLISTGGTLARGATACRERGAKEVYAAVTHGLFVGDSARVFAGPDIARLVITDSIPPFRLDPALVRDKVTVLDTAPLVAEAMRRMHCGGSLVALME
jgi:ribose-phosphate pyrophosphokinase